MEVMDDLQYDTNLDFDFNYKDTSAKFLLEVKDVSFGYNPENILFKDITFALSKGETLGIIGKMVKEINTFKCNCRGTKALSGSVEYHTSTVLDILDKQISHT